VENSEIMQKKKKGEGEIYPLPNTTRHVTFYLLPRSNPTEPECKTTPGTALRISPLIAELPPAQKNAEGYSA
jgi:hypothetical protein